MRKISKTIKNMLIKLRKTRYPFLKIPRFAPIFIILNLAGFTIKFALLTLTSMAGTASAFIFVYLLGDVVSNSSALTIDRLKSFYIPLFILAIFIKELFDYFLRRFGEPFSTIYVDRIRLRFLNSLLDSSSQHTQNISPHRSLSILDKYLGNIRESLDEWLWNGSRKLVQLAISLGILYYQSPVVLWANLTYFLSFAFITYLISKRYLPFAQRYAQADLNASSNINSFAFQIPSILKIGARGFFQESYLRSTKARAESLYSLKRFHADRWFIQLVLFYLGYIATLIYGAWQVQSGALALGFLVLIKYAFDLLNGVIIYISEYSVNLIRQRTDADIIRKELGHIEISDTEQRPLVNFNRFIHLLNCSCRFTTKDGATRSISIPNFSISRGERVGVMGASGAGKSTLLSLVTGILGGDGEIYIDDERYLLGNFQLNDATIVSPADPLFNTTILENLTMGRSVNESEIRKVLTLVCAENFLPNLDLEYGSDSVHFSTGQLQRIRLARALISRPKFLLLDEPFTGIDSSTRKKIIQNLIPYLAEMSVILVTHEKEDLVLTQRSYHFHDGKLLES